MSNKEEIFQLLKQYVVERFGVQEDSIIGSMTLEDLGADSLDIVELVMELECKFNMRFTDEQITEIHTIDDLVRYIEMSTK